MRRTLTAVALGAVLTVTGCTKDDRPKAKYVAHGTAIDNVKLARSEAGPAQTIGNPEPAALFVGPMPTGVAVSKSDRLFVCYPRWGDPVEYTVAEVTGGKARPFPNAQAHKGNAATTDAFVSVQSVYVDDRDRLWLLDTGSVNFQPVIPGTPKLVAYDLKTSKE